MAWASQPLEKDRLQSLHVKEMKGFMVSSEQTLNLVFVVLNLFWKTQIYICAFYVNHVSKFPSKSNLAGANEVNAWTNLSFFQNKYLAQWEYLS